MKTCQVESLTPSPRTRDPDLKQPTPPKVQRVVTPYAKIQLAAAKRAEEAEKQGSRKKKAVPGSKFNVDSGWCFFCISLSVVMIQCVSSLSI